jgi:antirestriction protein ArdC
LQLLKDDPKAIFTAAAKASEAVGWLKRQQPVQSEIYEPKHDLSAAASAK